MCKCTHTHPHTITHAQPPPQPPTSQVISQLWPGVALPLTDNFIPVRVHLVPADGAAGAALRARGIRLPAPLQCEVGGGGWSLI